MRQLALALLLAAAPAAGMEIDNNYDVTALRVQPNGFVPESALPPTIAYTSRGSSQTFTMPQTLTATTTHRGAGIFITDLTGFANYGVTSSTSIRVNAGGFRGPTNTPESPTFGFTSAFGLGMYSPASNQLGFATQGALRLTIDDNGVTTVQAIAGSGAGLTGVTASSVAAAGVTAGALPNTVIASSIAVGAITAGNQFGAANVVHGSSSTSVCDAANCSVTQTTPRECLSGSTVTITADGLNPVRVWWRISTGNNGANNRFASILQDGTWPAPLSATVDAGFGANGTDKILFTGEYTIGGGGNGSVPSAGPHTYCFAFYVGGGTDTVEGKASNHMSEFGAELKR